MRPGKRERAELRKTLSKVEYAKATKDVSRNERKIQAGTKMSGATYRDFKRWVGTKLGYEPKRIIFKKSNEIMISSDEEDETSEKINSSRVINGEELNDTLINAYQQLISERSEKFSSLPLIHSFDSHFFFCFKRKRI